MGERYQRYLYAVRRAVAHLGRKPRGRVHAIARHKIPRAHHHRPYAYIRHPIYVGNFLIGLGMIVLAEAFILVPIFLVLFTLQYRAIVSAEETFLKETFGSEFDHYCRLVPKYIPRVMPRKFSLGRNFPLKELGTACGIIRGALFLEWIKSPLHRLWIVGLWYWLEAVLR